MKVFLLPVVFCLFAVGYSALSYRSHDGSQRGTLLDRIVYMHKTRSNEHPGESITKLSNLKTFSFKNCGDPKNETAIMVDLSVTPDPIELPGDIAVNFSINNMKVAQAPLEADVQMKKKIGADWVTVPCIGQIGSCHYDDFCDILNLIPQCPEPLVDHGIPCKCPFQPNNYTLPTTSFTVKVAIMPAGDYFLQMNMTMNKEPATCFQVYLSFA